jgi:hypothetical protein
MLQHIAKNCLPIMVIASLCIYHYQVSAQNKVLPDNACKLTQVDSATFNSFANSRIKPSINDIPQKAGVNEPFALEILYIFYSGNNGNFMGASLPLDNNYKALKLYRFTFNNKDSLKTTTQNWTDSRINISNVVNETAGFMNSNNNPGGTDELLLVRRNGQPVNGFIFKGCATDAIDKEKNVHNKDYLQLLMKIRKMIVP